MRHLSFANLSHSRGRSQTLASDGYDERIANGDEQGEKVEGYKEGSCLAVVGQCQYEGKKEEVTESHSPAQSD